jgi:hypothetical protein
VLGQAYSAVCYLFGKASSIPFVYAIHDEDTLEFVHTLQINGGEGIKRLFSELRKQNLLLIGCDMADWLSRFFIRLSNTRRLADNRTKHEFLIERQTEDGGGLTLFLERFSPDTWVFRDGARQFVAELARRWHERNPNPLPRPEEIAAQAMDSEPRPRAEDMIFVSYAHEDVAAARQLLASLQEIARTSPGSIRASSGPATTGCARSGWRFTVVTCSSPSSPQIPKVATKDSSVRSGRSRVSASGAYRAASSSSLSSSTTTTMDVPTTTGGYPTRSLQRNLDMRRAAN